MIRRAAFSACSLALLLAAQPAGAAEGAPLLAPKDRRLLTLEAMKAELARSMEGLKLQDHEAPYFISYQVKEQQSHMVAARYGALFDDRSKRDSKVAVDVRVGSYDRDSSEGAMETGFFFSDVSGPTYMAQDDLPLSGEKDALRNALWLLTDQKYKAALSAWLKGKAQSVYAPDSEEKGLSFSREEPVRRIQAPLDFPFEKEGWGGVAARISGAFRAHPEIFDSEVRVMADKIVRIHTSSEGSELVTEEAIYAIHVQAVTRAVDGELLDNARSFYAATEAGLPTAEHLQAATEEMITELLALRVAPVIDPYTGPALLAPEATGVLFHETIGHRLEGERLHDDNEGRTFKGQIGVRILPSFLSVVDDPTVRRHGKESLNGAYEYDDQAVPGQRTVLIEKGVLKSYLLSRKPVKGFERSNGHGRAQGNRSPMARMANLFVDSSKRVPERKLREMLIAEAKKANKPYALIIKDITGGNTNTSTYGYQAFKGIPRMVYRIDVATGKEELVRGVEIVGTPLASINKIIAMGDVDGVFNGYCGAESGYVPVSAIAPAALIREIELQRTAKANERSPLLPSPWATKKREG